jgi:hypothetical protein
LAHDNPGMNTAVRSAVKAAQSAINGVRSRGPATPEGKERSSLNAVRYGFSSAHLLLPGEDAAEYKSHLDSYFAELVPTSTPEAMIVAQLGDLSWKVERLTKVENNRLRARLEEELEKTELFQRVVQTRRALEAVSSLAATVDTHRVVSLEPELTEILLGGVEGTLALLREVSELPEAVIQPMASALDQARETRQEGRLKQTAYEHLGNMAKLTRGALTAKLAQEDAALEPVRERLAAEVLLLEDADLKKLERHRRLLENSMQRQLDLLGQMRSQVASARPEHQAEAKELRVRLRVVRD